MVRGDVVRVWMDRPGSSRPRRGAFEAGDLRVVHEDDDLVVVDKPPGLLTVPLDRRAGAASVVDLLALHWRSRGKRLPLVVHRIDRDTSGLVIFAANPRAQQHLKQQFLRREPERVYLGGAARTAAPRGRGVARPARVEREGVDPAEGASRRSGGARRRLHLPCGWRRSMPRRWWRCASTRASRTRFASRRSCTGTRWSVSGAMWMKTCAATAWRLPGRRCTPSACRSAIRPTIGRCASKRRCRRTSGSFWRA